MNTIKKYLSVFIGLLFLLGVYHVGAEVDENDISCYREISDIQGNEIQGKSNIYINTPYYTDIYAMQGGQALKSELLSYDYTNVAFRTNIDQFVTNKKYKNDYSYQKLDTSQEREIIITLTEDIKTEKFRLDFLHSSRLYRPKFYISEDNELTYSQVILQDISDFSPTHIKIVFELIGNQELREIIEIDRLQIVRTDFLWSISPGESSENIQVYAGNVCGYRAAKSQNYTKVDVSKIDMMRLIFKENTIYLQKRLDTDGDRVTDYYDNCIYVANFDQKDININKIGDACEFDTDKDGIPDSIDNCRNTPNPDQSDTDGDGIGDVCDNCNLYNPEQKDTDNSGIGDVCEEKERFILENDDDGDKVINSADICPKIYDPDQKDDDGDRVGDVCDNCLNIFNPDQKDENNNGIGDTCEDNDGDKIIGYRDNCPYIFNPEQKDGDNNGIGDECDDDDGDSIINSLDTCRYKYNPDQSDIDDDTLGDVCDENDDRLLESNKIIIIIFMIGVGLLFVFISYTLFRKIQK